MSYKENIAAYYLSSTAKKKKVQVKCTNASGGKAVSEAISALWGNTYNIKKVKKGLSYKDFTLEMGSKEEASALVKALNKTKSTTPKPVEETQEEVPMPTPTPTPTPTLTPTSTPTLTPTSTPTSKITLTTAPVSSGTEPSGDAVVPEGTTNKKMGLYIGIGAGVLVLLIVVLLVWKRR